MSDDVIDNYDLDNNVLFVRGCNLIDIADANRYLQNAWFALTGSLVNEEQMNRLIQSANSELKQTDPVTKIKAMHQLINALPSLTLMQRFMMLLSQVEVSAAQRKVMAPINADDCLKIILLMPWIISLARSSEPFFDVPAIENCKTFEHAFWLALTGKAASSGLEEESHCRFMSLLLGGFGTVTPTTTTVRFIASTKSDVISALIGGFCATGPAHMGACKYAIMRLSSVIDDVEKGNIDAAANHYCKDKPWPGFGHPIMRNDVRVDFFFSRFHMLMRPFSALARAISDNSGLQPNVDFLIASVMSAHRVAPELGLLAFFVCRMPILLAHYQARFSAHSFGLSSEDLREKYKKVPQSWL